MTAIVATLPRSGSNLLCALMGSTGRLGRPREYFNPVVIEQEYPGRGDTFVDRCRLAAGEGATENGVVAFKLFTWDFEGLTKAIRVSAWFGAPRFVWLQRRDIVAQGISESRANQTQRWTAQGEAQVPAVYDGEDIAWRIHQITIANAHWHSYFARAGIAPLEIWYEDLEADPAKVIAVVAAELGVDMTGAPAPAQERFTRQRTAETEAWRARYHREFGDADAFVWQHRQDDKRPAAKLRRLAPRVRRRLRRLVGAGRFAGH